MAFRFLQFKVYQDAKVLHRRTVFTTKSFPRVFYYLRDQVRRSSLSVALTIAEGSAKKSDKDFNRYIQMSLGSANETASSFDIAFDCRLISKDEYQEIIVLCEIVTNQLGGFSKKLLVSTKS